MKNKNQLRTALFISGTALFNFLFWNENLGINLLIFNIFIVVGCLLNYKRNQKTITLSITTTLLSLFVVYHNSDIAKTFYWCSLIILIGYTHSNKLRSIPYAIYEALSNYFTWFKQIKVIKKTGNTSIFMKKYSRLLRLIIIPVIVTFIFYALFKAANPIFDEYTTAFWDSFYTTLETFFADFSFWHLLFIAWGASLMGWIFYVKKESSAIDKEFPLAEILIRKKIKVIKTEYSPKVNPIALVNENNAGTMLIAMVNLMLLLVNIIDINWIWFGFDYAETTHLSQFVHEGTYLLITSIVLSMVILLYLFRNNQNFYPRSKRLMQLSYAWIIQNIVLVVSVGIRNYHYIHEFGLAYKRIGVVFFLLTTIAGIITMAIKIRDKKSGFYLTRVNAWVVYGCFFILSIANWDTVITEYNINNSKKFIDYEYLFSLSSNGLPLINETSNIPYTSENNWKTYKLNIQTLTNKVHNFNKYWENSSWVSWNYADHKTYNYLKTIKK
jgi:hypothetical protein